MDAKLLAKLNKRKEEGTFRSLTEVDLKIDFFSNDYLGIARDSINQISSNSGATGSRLLSGNSLEAISCETFLADFFQCQSSLVFNSGFTANLALLSSVPQRGDTIIYDEFVHASIRDGIRLSFANSNSFQHNDFSDLKQQLKKAKGSIYVVIESLYSMNGDIAPLKNIASLCEEFNAYLIVDEAHSIGVFGSNGRGIVDGLNLQSKVFARVISFGKAYGFHGAAILGSSELKDFLINFARPFIYTTGLPPADYQTIQSNVAFNIKERQDMLHKNLVNFRDGLNQDKRFTSAINSPIQVVQMNSILGIKDLVGRMNAVGIYTKPIFSPTVPVGSECIRICMHSFNTIEEIHILKSLF
jgi:8-amino-7-oxononanoate synthase